MKNRFSFKLASLSIIWAWLIIFALGPFVLILGTSILQHDVDHLVIAQVTASNFLQLFQPLYLNIFLRSFYLAGLCTFFCLVIAYPFAYIIARSRERFKNILLLLVIIPFWTSSMIRTYAMMAILKTKGLLNGVLLWLHIIHAPLLLLYSNTAVIIGLVYNLLPFMVLPLYANIEKLDYHLVDAARDLGANKITIFRRIIIPLTAPGIIAGVILVFLPAMTLFYIPDILGGAKSVLLGNLIENQFLFVNNWPEGSAISIALTIIMAFLLMFYRKKQHLSLKQDLF